MMADKECHMLQYGEVISWTKGPGKQNSICWRNCPQAGLLQYLLNHSMHVKAKNYSHRGQQHSLCLLSVPLGFHQVLMDLLAGQKEPPSGGSPSHFRGKQMDSEKWHLQQLIKLWSLTSAYSEPQPVRVKRKPLLLSALDCFCRLVLQSLYSQKCHHLGTQ